MSDIVGINQDYFFRGERSMLGKVDFLGSINLCLEKLIRMIVMLVMRLLRW